MLVEHGADSHETIPSILVKMGSFLHSSISLKNMGMILMNMVTSAARSLVEGSGDKHL